MVVKRGMGECSRRVFVLFGIAALLLIGGFVALTYAQTTLQASNPGWFGSMMNSMGGMNMMGDTSAMQAQCQAMMSQYMGQCEAMMMNQDMTECESMMNAPEMTQCRTMMQEWQMTRGCH